ncbi:hypothetical protein D3C81_2265030 [compost metagenome]
MAIIDGNRILIKPKEGDIRVYDYKVGKDFGVTRVENAPDREDLRVRLESFIQTATKSLLDNTAGVVDGKPDAK